MLTDAAPQYALAYVFTVLLLILWAAPGLLGALVVTTRTSLKAELSLQTVGLCSVLFLLALYLFFNLGAKWLFGTQAPPAVSLFGWLGGCAALFALFFPRRSAIDRASFR